MDFNNLKILLEAGPMIYPLGLLAFIGLVVFIERSLFLHKSQINVKEFIAGIKNLLGKGRLVEALAICEETRASSAQLVKTVLLNYEQDIDLILINVRKRLSLELPELERRVGLISVVARLSPLVGFLGTLVAGIEIISHLSLFDGSSTLLVSALANALISSALGLIICVLATAGHHFLEVRITHMIHDYEWICSEMIDILIEERTGQRDGTKESE
jgi:biopolymer transport protein ExbB